MRSSALARRSALPRGWRWLLVLLTLVASLMHLTRSPAVGGLGLSGPLAQALVPPQTQAAKAAPSAHAAADPAPMADDMAMEGPPMVTPAAHPVAAPPRPDLTEAAPNAPPAQGHSATHPDHHTGDHPADHPADHAAAHCPFCLSAGFALESAPTLLAFVPLATLHAEAVRSHGPASSFVRHADPRAPPGLA